MNAVAVDSTFGLPNCPIGGGVEACFVFRWFKCEGIQKFQPLQPGEYRNRDFNRDPYDESTFRPDLPIFEFQKMRLPSTWAESGFSDVWVRIE